MRQDDSHEQLFDLVEQLCVGTLEEESARQLREYVVTNASARAEYVRLMDLHGRLTWSLRSTMAGDSPIRSQPPMSNTIPIMTRLGGPRQYMTRPVLGSIAVVALAFYGIFALLAWNLRSDDHPTTKAGLDAALAIDAETNPRTEDRGDPAAIAARWTDGSNCVWQLDEGEKEPQIGSLFPANKSLALSSGVAELTFGDGAKVLLQGPAMLDLLTASRAHLHAGRIVAHVPPPAVGFTIETPNIRLVDRGTEFGVTVDSNGRTDVQVFTGAVDISYLSHVDAPNAKPRTVRMTAGKAKRFGNRADDHGVAVTEMAPWFEAAEAQNWLAGHGKLLPAETIYAATVLADHPIAYWRLSDHGNRLAADASGNAAQAEYHGLIETNIPGICPTTSDRSIRFLGKTGAGWLEMKDLKMPASFTVEFWARSASPDWNTDGWLVTSRSPYGFLMHPDGGSRGWRFLLVGNRDGEFYQIGRHFPQSIDDCLHHYVGTYDAEADRGCMFFDGQLVAEAGEVVAPVRRRAQTLTIYVGSDERNPDRLGTGWIDELAIYDCALEPESVQQHFHAAAESSASTTTNETPIQVDRSDLTDPK